jgi:hypothetical protein
MVARSANSSGPQLVRVIEFHSIDLHGQAATEGLP